MSFYAVKQRRPKTRAQMLQIAYGYIEYDRDLMPDLSWEEGTGFFFENATAEELKNFCEANHLDPSTDQGNIEAWIDDTCSSSPELMF